MSLSSDDKIECMSGGVIRFCNMLHHVKRLKQLLQLHSVFVVAAVDMDVELPQRTTGQL